MATETATVQDERLERLLQIGQTGTLFTIRDLASEFQLSPSHLQHLFKAQTGETLGQWLLEQRLNRAANMLVESAMSVKEVAYAVGYKHPSSFVRAFERHFRSAPGCYRKKC